MRQFNQGPANAVISGEYRIAHGGFAGEQAGAILAALLAAPTARAQARGEVRGIWLTLAGDAGVRVSK
jgi:hypothetical protein